MVVRMAGLDAWVRVVRAKFWLAGIPPVILGVAVSWYLVRMFSLPYFLLTLLGVIFAMVGCYTFNEYFDFKSGVDLAVKNEDITPFNAGSRVLPEGLIKPFSVFRVGIVSWILTFVVAFYLTLVRGLLVFSLALVGFFMGAFYTSPPFKWAYRGLGEILIGLTYGPLITFGSCYVQLASLPFKMIILPSLVSGLLITAVIWINEFPDYHADKKAGKNNLVVRMGKEKAVNIYVFLLIAPYLILVLGVLLRLLPYITLLTFLTFPLAYKNMVTAKKKYSKSKELILVMERTILLFVLFTLLLAVEYILSTLL
ncbi:MAG: hypothetical protein DRO36_07050 [Candidatus Hecatellales archaeon]|nr:MAG: hypothetical protein DRO36_07050 [Candidatus Hecatellales archaeon]